MAPAMNAGRFDGSISFSMIHKVMWLLISIPEIIVAPSGKAKPTACAIVVVNAPKFVAIKKTIQMDAIEFSNPLKIFPFDAATDQMTVKGNTAKSAKGNKRLNGRIAANKIVIGTINSATVIIAGWAVTTAASKPMYTAFPGKRF